MGRFGEGRPDVEPRTDSPDPTAEDPLAIARILIVDDQESNVLLLDRLLRFAGARDIHTVIDAREAVSRCLQVEPDLVLLDIHMPHLDGVAVLKQLLAAVDPTVFLPVIILTADTTDTARHRALAAGAKDFLTKPLERDEVLLRVRNHLETASLHARLRAENEQLRARLQRHERGALVDEFAWHRSHQDVTGHA